MTPLVVCDNLGDPLRPSPADDLAGCGAPRLICAPRLT